MVAHTLAIRSLATICLAPEIRSIVVYGVEFWSLRKVDEKYLECYEMWHRRRMEEGQLDRSYEKRKSVTKSPTKNEEKETNWIGHILGGNWLLKHVIEGKTEERLDIAVRGGRRRKQLLDDINPLAPEFSFRF
jgi:hypothetical protein